MITFDLHTVKWYFCLHFRVKIVSRTKVNQAQVRKQRRETVWESSWTHTVLQQLVLLQFQTGYIILENLLCPPWGVTSAFEKNMLVVGAEDSVVVGALWPEEGAGQAFFMK